MKTMRNQPNENLMLNIELFLSNSFPFIINRFFSHKDFGDKEGVNNQCNLSTQTLGLE